MDALWSWTWYNFLSEIVNEIYVSKTTFRLVRTKAKEKNQLQKSTRIINYRNPQETIGFHSHNFPFP